VRIFRELERSGVDYVLIGGWAVIAHGSTRVTRDVDLIPAPEATNYERLARVLRNLDARLSGVDAHLLGIDLDAPTLAEGANFTLETAAGPLDVMQSVPGAPPYADLRGRASQIEVLGVAIPIVGREDLIRLKLASGREKDLADVGALTAGPDLPG
jgi:predicted nucleotidyltransferase